MRLPGKLAHWPIDRLRPYERNPRTHSPEQITKVAASLLEFGWTNPILVDGNGVVVAGHGRLLAARELGMKTVPVIELGHLTEVQRRAYCIADNRLALEAGWDEELLAEELRALDGLDFNLELTGFALDELHDLLEDESAEELPAPEPPDVPVTRPGDLWTLGEHRLLCGDATIKEDLERLMGGRAADMVFTDPPYGVSYEGKTKEALTLRNDSTTEVFADSIPLWPLKPGGAVYVCCPAGSNFIDFEIPFRERCHHASTLIWAKNSMVLGHGDYHFQHEAILYGWDKSAAHQWYGDRTQTTLWSVDRPSASREHPTMKPVELPARAVRNSSKVRALVLDPFGGAGSTLIACEQLGRACFTMELDPAYCDVIVQRWEAATGERAALQEGGATFEAAAADRRVALNG